MEILTRIRYVLKNQSVFWKLAVATLSLVILVDAIAQNLPQQLDSTDSARQNQGLKQGQKRGRADRDQALNNAPADVAALRRLSVILGRPTLNSVTASILTEAPAEVQVEWGYSAEHLDHISQLKKLSAGEVSDVEITGLTANSRCYYHLKFRSVGEHSFQTMATESFHTARSTGSQFIFEMQGDSHPERPQQFDPSLYAQTLRAAAADEPDFYITLGDDFSVDTLKEINSQTVEQRYLLQRPYLALVGRRSPIYMVNGNHEQAAAVNLDGTPNNVAVWAQSTRNHLFPLPVPDQFYSGDIQDVPYIGKLRDYYSWTWGDALFVVIDPYWHSSVAVDNKLGSRVKNNKSGDDHKSRGKEDMWNITLGDEQYNWLQKTLKGSTSKYKFVFSHHVLGTGRGGIEVANLYEWGGHDRQGNDLFANYRPNWLIPIHQLFAQNGVTAFFQGHDHVFAHQQLDGIVYQTLAQPADPNYTLNFSEAYRSGKILPNSGRLRVTVTAEKAKVEYVRSFLPIDQKVGQVDNSVAYSYELVPRK
ncbi:metallophosphoesterase family protein [Sapientia aquatica]|uniref:Calcineurin-like phosphoesterase domain-containing protein n=1 Tax=Sapientia aquatica TaxID=1549640 RepID=A0A4R5W221_9BURK|nr:metallophosphoesterase [Sapientia aquatica]TDK66372.1 hypothetical protein E2I14_07815 [Sapientia aquatica]